ncbi:MAG: DNA repair protein RecN [Bryobacteraceae bacterium]
MQRNTAPEDNLQQMLLELLVENYAVVERVSVRFHSGLNVLTGETGSGKSIVVDALGLLFGGRASAEMVRSGADRARISGIFELPADPRVHTLLSDAGIETEESELLIEREIQANGKTRAFANSRPATAALLKDLAPWLGDIHGQHDQQRLFHPASQLDTLDSFAANASLLELTAVLYKRWHAIGAELAELDRNEQEKLRLADLWNFQRQEIDSAALHPGEDAALEAERRILQNVNRLQETATAAYEALYDVPASAVAQLRIAFRKLEEIARIDATLGEMVETLKPAQIALDEVSRTLQTYVGKLEADPARLEDIESRLALIDKLKRKYGATVDGILTFAADVRSKLEALESTAERRAALHKERERLRAEYDDAAARLSARRRAAATDLEQRVVAELSGLGMERTVFHVALTACEPTAHGADEVQFLVSPNVGEEPKPMEKIASGGELSRIALALKTCATSSNEAARTLVFDEVDAGIGGAAAERVGARLKSLAAANQVLCVTHLAQIAGFGSHHYSVEKREVQGRTIAEIEELTGDARVREIGRMLSGNHLTPEALRHAEQLIRK